MNSSVLTNFGSYTYEAIPVDEAKKLLLKEGYRSAIGHKATAELLSALLEMNIPMNRIEYSQQTGEIALVFKLSKRQDITRTIPPDELPALENWELGLLKRLK